MTSTNNPHARHDAPSRIESAGAQLFAPWRLTYLESLKTTPDAPTPNQSPAPSAPPPAPSCFIRRYWLEHDRDVENLVILRTSREGLPPAKQGRGGLILMNRYPYTNGHLLVALAHSRMRLLDYSPQQRDEFWSLVDLAVELVETTLEPQGVNIGINQGAAAGAGIPEHLHAHVVPRWNGDVNFMDAVGRVRIIPSALEDMYQRFTKTWQAIRPEPSRTNS